MATFLIGGCYSVAIAIQHLTRPEKSGNPRAAWIILAIAFVLDSLSLVQAFRQARAEARERKLALLSYFRRSSDPTVRAIVMEDGAALVGLLIAAAGLFLSQRLGSGRPDAIASLLIGLLMGGTGVVLALDHALRDASPYVADVYIDVTAHRP